mgnify:CR=1 FL=1
MTSFGDPNAPKFCYGRKEDTPVNHDLNWRNQIAKEKREMHQNELKNQMRREAMDGSPSARVYHPTHVPEQPTAFGRIRLGVCGTFIHEDGPAALAPDRTRKHKAAARDTARSGASAGAGRGGRAGELERAGGLGRYGASARSRGTARSRVSGRSPLVATARSSASLASRLHTGRTSASVSEELRSRLERETLARREAEDKIAALTLEVQRLKNGMSLRL